MARTIEQLRGPRDHLRASDAWAVMSRQSSPATQCRPSKGTHPAVLAILDADRRLDTHPDPDKTLAVGDVLVVIGGVDEVDALRAHFTAA